MWILALLAVVALAGLVRSVVVGSVADVEMIAQAGIALLSGGLFLFFRAQQKANERFFAWLQENSGALRVGETLTYEKKQVSSQTRLRTHQAAVSILVLSLKLPSRYYVGNESGFATATLCSLTSLIFGWWGIPWGPIWTIETVVRNLGGGKKTTVGELFAEATSDGAAS